MSEQYCSSDLKQSYVEESTKRSPARKQGQHLLMDLAASVLWGFFAAAYLSSVLGGRDILGVGLFLFYMLVTCFMVLRQPALRTGVWWENTLAWTSAFLPMAGMRPSAGGWIVPGLIVQALGLVGLIIALSSLGRSFGIAPADRGLVTTGLYRYVRHPLYATELLCNSGYVMANPSWRNLIILGLMLATQVIRILREERILANYASYAGRVRWRLLPGIW